MNRFDLDVLCLQECDTLALPAELDNLHLADSTKRNRLGLAVYYRRDRFTAVSTKAFALKKSLHDRILAPAHERLGYAHFKLEQYDQAMSSFQAALRLEPDYFPALNGVGVCELNLWHWSDKRDVGARDRAVAALRRSLAINRNQAPIEELLTRYR